MTTASWIRCERGRQAARRRNSEAELENTQRTTRAVSAPASRPDQTCRGCPCHTVPPVPPACLGPSPAVVAALLQQPSALPAERHLGKALPALAPGGRGHRGAVACINGDEADAPRLAEQVFRNKATPEAVDLMAKLLVYTPTSRLTPLQVKTAACSVSGVGCRRAGRPSISRPGRGRASVRRIRLAVCFLLRPFDMCPGPAHQHMHTLILHGIMVWMGPLAWQACAHPFFDELRDPNTRLPNSRLPPLFDFTPEEMRSVSGGGMAEMGDWGVTYDLIRLDRTFAAMWVAACLTRGR